MASSRPLSSNEGHSDPSSPNSRILTGDEPLINTRSGQLVTRFRVVGNSNNATRTGQNRDRNGSRYSHQSSISNGPSGALASDQQYRSTNSLHVPSSKRLQQPPSRNPNDVSRHGSVNFGTNANSTTALSAPLPPSKQNFNRNALPSSDRPRHNSSLEHPQSDRSLLLPVSQHQNNGSISSHHGSGGKAPSSNPSSSPLAPPPGNNNYYGSGETDEDDDEHNNGEEDEEEEESDYNTETEDEQDFGDEAFKQVADDINVNVDSLLKKLRQADTFDRRETMLKKGNVKNANVVQVEMYEDEDEDEEEGDGDGDADDSDEDENGEGKGTRSSGARKIWDRLTGNSSPSLITSNNNLPQKGANKNSNNVNKNEEPSAAAPQRAEAEEEAQIASAEKEREATLIASNAAAATDGSKENEDVLVNEMAQQAKARLTADKHSGSTQISKNSANKTNKSSIRFGGTGTRDSNRDSEEMSVSSRATLRDDASSYSLTDGKPRSAMKRNKNAKKKKAAVVAVPGGRTGVSFSQNEVSEVCIFEVGDELFVGVQFKRSWVGWVAAFLAVIFETVFDVHVVFLYETVPESIGAIQGWVGCQRLIVSGIVFFVAYFVGIGVQPLKHVTSPYGMLILSLMALALALGVSLEAVVVDVTNATHFFIASVLYCLWIVLYRLFIKEAVFLLEVIAILVTVGGFIISNLTLETNMDTKAAVTGNLLIFVASILYAAYFFLLSRARKWAPIIPMATFQGVFAIIVALPLAAILKAPASEIFAFFTNGTYFGHSLIIAIEGVISNILLILTIDYLDVLSVATIFVLKSAVMPIFAKLIIIDHFTVIPSRKPASFEITWYVILGYALAIIGSIITVVFASLRRSFVTRRIASSKRKKAPNPYTKKRRRMEREAAAQGLSLQEHQQQMHQQQQYNAYLQQQQLEQQHYAQQYNGQHHQLQQQQQYYYQDQGSNSPTHLSPAASGQLPQQHQQGKRRGGSPSKHRHH